MQWTVWLLVGSVRALAEIIYLSPYFGSSLMRQRSVCGRCCYRVRPASPAALSSCGDDDSPGTRELVSLWALRSSGPSSAGCTLSLAHVGCAGRGRSGSGHIQPRQPSGRGLAPLSLGRAPASAPVSTCVGEGAKGTPRGGLAAVGRTPLCAKPPAPSDAGCPSPVAPTPWSLPQPPWEQPELQTLCIHDRASFQHGLPWLGEGSTGQESAWAPRSWALHGVRLPCLRSACAAQGGGPAAGCHDCQRVLPSRAPRSSLCPPCS